MCHIFMWLAKEELSEEMILFGIWTFFSSCLKISCVHWYMLSGNINLIIIWSLLRHLCLPYKLEQISSNWLVKSVIRKAFYFEGIISLMEDSISLVFSMRASFIILILGGFFLYWQNSTTTYLFKYTKLLPSSPSPNSYNHHGSQS